MIVFRTRQHAGIKNHCAKTAQDCAGFTLHPGLPAEEIFWRSPRCLCLPHLCLTLVGLQLTKLQFHRIWWDLPQWMPRCFCSTEGHPEKTTSFCFRKNNILASGNLSSRSRERGCASDMHVPSAIQIAHNHWSRAKKIRTVASSRLTPKTYIYIYKLSKPWLEKVRLTTVNRRTNQELVGRTERGAQMPPTPLRLICGWSLASADCSRTPSSTCSTKTTNHYHCGTALHPKQTMSHCCSGHSSAFLFKYLQSNKPCLLTCTYYTHYTCYTNACVTYVYI